MGADGRQAHGPAYRPHPSNNFLNRELTIALLMQ